MPTLILLLLTLRQEALLTDSELQEHLNRLRRDTTLVRLDLNPLDVTSLTLLISQLAGTTIPNTPIQQLSRWFYDETQGHPFFITEILHMLTERNLLVYQSGQPNPAPDALTRPPMAIRR